MKFNLLIALFSFVTLAALADGPVTQVSPFMRPVLESQNSADAQNRLGFTGNTALQVISNYLATVPIAPFATNAAAATNALNAGNATNVSWFGIFDTNKVWAFSEDANNSLIISNRASAAYVRMTTNGDFYLISTNNPSQQTFGQFDESEIGAQGIGVLGDDFENIVGNDAYIELGGTSPYWGSVFGCLPSWHIQKNGPANVGSQDLEIFAHANCVSMLPFDLCLATNGSATLWSNLVVQAQLGVGGGIVATGTVTSAAFYNGSVYQPSGISALTGNGDLLHLNPTGSSSTANLCWLQPGIGPVFRMTIAQTPSDARLANWTVQMNSETGQGGHGLYQQSSDGQSGALTNFTAWTGLASHCTNYFGTNIFFQFGPHGVTNNTLVNMVCYGVSCSSGTLWMSNTLNGTVIQMAASIGTIPQTIILQPGESLLGSTLTEQSDGPF